MTVRSDHELARRVDALRAFNRFYTRRIGVLEERHLQSPFSLAEARVLYELSQRKKCTATDVGRELGLDLGYLSRILRRFERKGLITRKASATDARQSLLQLTPKGREAFAPLNAKSQDIMRSILQSLAPDDQSHLLASMQSIREILGGSDRGKRVLTLRTHRYGDMAWIVAHQIDIYEREYGWRERFEYLMLRIAADILENFDPKREHIWIAELDGKRVGSACVVAESKSVARLRLLLVEPEARGLGIGRKLVGQCIEFARAAGYRSMILWTQDVLQAARANYEKAGFRLTRRKKHRDFGVPLTGETWEIKL
ncbi:MAG: bifunctional helix-turn-helix transcriptional regulator/GNAT family N-acetyltransferase [Bradyrhizobiaceae bacterium]|nr:bifunctional helix-turn-helix transcriptional regulator/GNAT family N-acetyltransferase [Bradyrhizobiaceae bacterium]